MLTSKDRAPACNFTTLCCGRCMEHQMLKIGGTLARLGMPQFLPNDLLRGDLGCQRSDTISLRRELYKKRLNGEL